MYYINRMSNVTNRGGRPPLPPDQKGNVRTVRLTDSRWEKLKLLGSMWLNMVIDAAIVPAEGRTDTSTVKPAPYVTVDLAASLTGYTEKAIRRKIQDGIWLEGREYRKSPDGRILISMAGYQSWVERGHK